MAPPLLPPPWSSTMADSPPNTVPASGSSICMRREAQNQKCGHRCAVCKAIYLPDMAQCGDAQRRPREAAVACGWHHVCDSGALAGLCGAVRRTVIVALCTPSTSSKGISLKCRVCRRPTASQPSTAAASGVTCDPTRSSQVLVCHTGRSQLCCIQ